MRLGYFVDAEGIAPSDALALFCWVQGYHAQLHRLGVDATALSPSLIDAANDLIEGSSRAFAQQLTGMADADAFAPRLPIPITPSGRPSEAPA